MTEIKRYQRGKHSYTKWGSKFKEVKVMSDQEDKKQETQEQQKKEIKVQIELDDATAQGCYSNLALISHNQTEFVLDFIYLQPQQPKAKVRTRIIMAPANAKRLLGALGQNLAKYEQQFGAIGAAPEPAQKIGFSPS